jgi:hypothetical protein
LKNNTNILSCIVSFIVKILLWLEILSKEFNEAKLNFSIFQLRKEKFQSKIKYLKYRNISLKEENLKL